jgi:glucosamine--fructose-6-phosphate aminotransferase (isomerizing)
MFYIGRGIDSVLCSEASLKLKEISYVHSEAYPSGELKHGTISLITEGVGVFAILTDERLYLKSIGNIEEAAARGGSVIALCKEGFCKDKNYDLIPCRISNDLFAPFAVAPRFQYFAYCMTIIKNLDPDKPRNLAKSVTVE